ncbi:MAG: sulfurtransferase TusA family protein [Stellaceae bacterium]
MTEPTILDAQGLRCPIPVLKARKAMKALPAGATLRILATDPGAIKDFEAFCKTTGYRLLSASQDGDVLTFDIQKTA